MIFRVSRSSFRCQKLFLLNTYYLLGPKWSQIGTKLVLILLYRETCVTYFETLNNMRINKQLNGCNVFRYTYFIVDSYT